MKNILLLILFIPFFLGCDSQNDVIYKGYNNMCDRQPSSLSCSQHEDTGRIPSYSDVHALRLEALTNFRYVSDQSQYGVEDYWTDGITTSTITYGDCEDIAITFASQLMLDGVKPSAIRLVMSGDEGGVKHAYTIVKLDDGTIYNFYKHNLYVDIMYMQYDNIGVFLK